MKPPREPDFSRLAKVLSRSGVPDRVPFYELFADQEIVSAILGRHPGSSLKDRVDYQLKLGYDYVYAWPRNVEFPLKGCASAKDTAALPHKERVYHTASMRTITSWQDFEKYPWPDPSKADYSEIEQLALLMPEGMKVIVMSGHVLEAAIGLMGYEGLSFAMVDQPDLVTAVFARVGEVYESIYKACPDFDNMGAMLVSDDLGFKTGTMISPDALRRWVFPWYKRYAQISHSRKLPILLHSCGQLREVMDDIIDRCRIDAKHSFEDQILPVTEAKREYGHRIALLGGIDLHLLCTATEKEVRRETRKTLEACMPGGGYALGTGNTVANYVPILNFLAMLDEGARAGVY